jgi:hypothetical protein
MKHFLILLSVALITLAIMFALYYPDLLEDIWLWIIGLIGPIIAIFQRIIGSVQTFFKKLETEKNDK